MTTWTLVTGAAKGLGKEIALTLAEKGHHLIIHYNESEQCALEVVDLCRQKGVQAKAIQGDFSSSVGTQAFISHLHGIKHLVNNVGHFLIKPGLETPVEAWQQLYQVNFFAPLAMIQGFIESIREHKGTITSIGSVGVGILRADSKYTAYTSSKMSLCMLTKSLAKELAPDLVRVNMVSPGELEHSVSLKENGAMLPMKRAGTCREVADVVAFLIDEKNGYITGQNIEVGGALAL